MEDLRKIFPRAHLQVSCIVDEDVDATVDFDGFGDLGVKDRLWAADVEFEDGGTGVFEVLNSGDVAGCCDGFVAAGEDGEDELLAEAGGAACDEPDHWGHSEGLLMCAVINSG